LPRRLALAQADDAAASDVDGGEEVQGSYRLSAISYQRWLAVSVVSDERH
jgi:hypothetical protein